MLNWRRRMKGTAAGLWFGVRLLAVLALLAGFSAQPLCPLSPDSGFVSAQQSRLHDGHSGMKADEGKLADFGKTTACAAACTLTAGLSPMHTDFSGGFEHAQAAIQARAFAFQAPAPGPRPPMEMPLTV